MGLASALVGKFPEQMRPYLKIIRLHDPTLNVMVFWPTAWSLELSNSSKWPNLYLLILFFIESFILHGAGLILNDILDVSIDKQVKRTQRRPLLTGELSLAAAKCYLAFLLTVGISLLLQFSYKCLWLMTLCAVFSTIYPISKRFMYFPEIVLGISCGFSVLVARVAATGDLDWPIFTVFLSDVTYWTVSYTIYNSQDKHIDIRIHVKSAALKFGDLTKMWLWCMTGVFIISLVVTGFTFQQSWPYYLFTFLAGAIIAYKIVCVDLEKPESCYEFYSFSSVGFIILLGIVAGNMMKKQPIMS